MLTNDHAAVCNQSFGSSAFLVDIEPGVGVHNFHGNIGVNALHAQEECSVAGNNLSIVVSTDIANLDLAVSGKAVGLGLRGQGAGLNQFLQLHTGNNTGNITALINIGESVLEVIQASQGSKITGHGNKSDIGILFSFFYDIGLVAVRVGNNKVAALANQVFCSVRALSTFGNLVLPNDLAVAHAKLLCSSLDAVDMRSSVAFRLVANRDNANLQVAGSCIGSSGSVSGRICCCAGCSAGCSSAAAGGHAEQHSCGQHNTQQFFHV